MTAHPADTISTPWTQLAACRTHPTAWWFPRVGQSPDSRAVRLCATCPVRRECLEVALADSGLAGIWGGHTTAERTAIRQGRAAAGDRRYRTDGKDHRNATT